MSREEKTEETSELKINHETLPSVSDSKSSSKSPQKNCPKTSTRLDPKPGTSKENNENDDLLHKALGLLQDEPGYPVVPRTNCPHIKAIGPAPDALDIKAGCSVCRSTQENWLCLTCYFVFCSRYVNEHMIKHNLESGHPVALSFSDLSVWCYNCDDYIDCEALYKIRNLVHVAKFGFSLPFYYSSNVLEINSL